MTPTPMTAIEPLRIGAVQPLHGVLERVFCDINDQVIVGRHEAKREACPELAFHDLRKPAAEIAAVGVIAKKRNRSRRLGGDVIDACFERSARLPGHANSVEIASSPVAPR